jgi:flagellar motor switch protein FliM
VKVNLGETEITLNELMNLRPGDVIPLDQDSSGEFDVLIEGVPKFQGYYGINHGSIAVQLNNGPGGRGKGDGNGRR